MKNTPLYTVAIVAYNNYKYIKDAIDSVFLQEYPNIELIISNDGSYDFDESELIIYLSAKKTDNIKRICINKNERNLGTCKHLNRVKSFARGDYIMFMAADDAFQNPFAVSQIVKAFSENEGALFVSGNCGMYDEKMQNCSNLVPIDSVKDKLKNLALEEFYRQLATDMFIPTAATTYSMKAFELLGDFDERVRLIEDWSFFLKAARNGYKPVYIDFELTKHRDGGIAHSSTSGINPLLYEDELEICKNEIYPYEAVLGKKTVDRVRKKVALLKIRYFDATNKDVFIGETLKFNLSDKYILLIRSFQGLIRYSAYATNIRAVLLAVLMFCVVYSAPLFGDAINDCIYIICGFGLIVFVALWLCRCLYLSVNLRKILKEHILSR